jgi:hypothetical protein
MLAALRYAQHLLAPLTANCSDFHQRWERALNDRPPFGRWRGEWVSKTTGHRGPLRCVIATHGPDQWRATFHAGYAKVLRACYATQLHVVQKDDKWIFSGRTDLGKLAGGVYEYDGTATVDFLVSRYRSPGDQGEFRLKSVRKL